MSKKFPGRSIQNPYGPLPERMDEKVLEGLIIKLRENKINNQEIENVFLSHIRLALSIVSQESNNVNHLVSDLISEAVLGIAEALSRAPAVLTDNNITPYISTIIKMRLKDYKNKQFFTPRKSYKRNGQSVAMFSSGGLLFGASDNKKKPILEDGGDANYKENNSNAFFTASHATTPSTERVIELKDTIENIILQDKNLVRRELKRAIIRLKQTDYTNKEIAAILDISESSVSRAIEDIRIRFEKEAQC